MNWQFVTVLAWVFGVLSTMLLVARIIGAITFTEKDRLRHAMRGEEVTFPMLWPSVIAIVCWAWIITT